MGSYGTGVYGTSVYGVDPSPPVQFGPPDLRVEMFLPYGAGGEGLWIEQTQYVRTEPGMSWSRGRTSEDDSPSPGRCVLTLDNRDGRFSPRNPAGVWFGKIGRNTPVRVGFGKPVVGIVDTDGPTPVVNFPQIATSHDYWGDVPVMAFVIAAADVTFTGPTGYTDATTQNVAGKFATRRAFTVDSRVVPATTMTASAGAAHAAVHIGVPGGTYVTSAGGLAADGAASPEIDLTGVPSGDTIVVVCGWTADPDDRMGPPVLTDDDTPLEMYLVADSGPSTGPRVAAWAWRHRGGTTSVSLAGALDGSTGATVQVAQFTGVDPYAPRFTGEISEWPVQWTHDEGDIVTPVVAGGALRRMAQSSDVTSALRGAFDFHSDVTQYWPMEDPPGSTYYAASVGTAPMVFVNGGAPGAVAAIAGSLETPDFTGHGARAPIGPANAPPWGFGGTIAIPAAGLTPGTNLLAGECGGSGASVSTFVLEYTSATALTFKVQYSSGAVASTSLGSLTSTFPGGVDGRQVFAYVAALPTGADVAWAVTISNVTPVEPFAQLTATGTLTAQTVGPLAAITVATEAGTSSTLGTNGLSVGHVFATSTAVHTSSIYRRAAARGWAGFPASEVAYAVARDQGYKMLLVYPPVDTATSGVLESSTAYQALADLEFAVQALLSDAAGFVGVEWKPLPVLESKAPVFEFVYSGDVFAEIEVTDDDAVLTNEVTITSTTQGQARAVVEFGALGSQSGGIGRYARDYTVPVLGQAQAADLAGWLTHLGTVDAARWPRLTLRMGGAGVAGFSVPTVSVGDTVRVSGLPLWVAGVESVDLVVLGFSETLNSAEWLMTLHTRLAQGYRVATPGLGAQWDTIGDDDDPDLYDPVYLGM